MTLLIVGCATGGKNSNQDANWYAFFVIIFYLISPIPFLMSKRYNVGMGMGGGTNSCQELAIFLTIGIVISSFGLPIVLARHPIDPVITASACWFTMGANIVVYLTILGFFLTFGSDDMDYSMW